MSTTAIATSPTKPVASVAPTPKPASASAPVDEPVIHGYIDCFKISATDGTIQFSYMIDRGLVSIGRDHRCGIRVNNLRVSRHQCDFEVVASVDGGLKAFITHLVSRPTTKVGSQQLATSVRTPIEPGTVFTIYDKEFRWREYDPAAAPSATVVKLSPHVNGSQLLEGKKKQQNSSKSSSRRASNATPTGSELRKSVLQKTFRRSLMEKVQQQNTKSPGPTAPATPNSNAQSRDLIMFSEDDEGEANNMSAADDIDVNVNGVVGEVPIHEQTIAEVPEEQESEMYDAVSSPLATPMNKSTPKRSEVSVSEPRDVILSEEDGQEANAAENGNGEVTAHEQIIEEVADRTGEQESEMHDAVTSPLATPKRSEISVPEARYLTFSEEDRQEANAAENGNGEEPAHEQTIEAVPDREGEGEQCQHGEQESEMYDAVTSPLATPLMKSTPMPKRAAAVNVTEASGLGMFSLSESEDGHPGASAAVGEVEVSTQERTIPGEQGSEMHDGMTTPTAARTPVKRTRSTFARSEVTGTVAEAESKKMDTDTEPEPEKASPVTPTPVKAEEGQKIRNESVVVEAGAKDNIAEVADREGEGQQESELHDAVTSPLATPKRSKVSVPEARDLTFSEEDGQEANAAEDGNGEGPAHEQTIEEVAGDLINVSDDDGRKADNTSVVGVDDVNVKANGVVPIHEQTIAEVPEEQESELHDAVSSSLDTPTNVNKFTPKPSEVSVPEVRDLTFAGEASAAAAVSETVVKKPQPETPATERKAESELASAATPKRETRTRRGAVAVEVEAEVKKPNAEPETPVTERKVEPASVAAPKRETRTRRGRGAVAVEVEAEMKKPEPEPEITETKATEKKAEPASAAAPKRETRTRRGAVAVEVEAEVKKPNVEPETPATERKAEPASAVPKRGTRTRRGAIAVEVEVEVKKPEPEPETPATGGKAEREPETPATEKNPEPASTAPKRGRRMRRGAVAVEVEAEVKKPNAEPETPVTERKAEPASAVPKRGTRTRRGAVAVEVEAKVKKPEPAPAKRAKRDRGEVEAKVKKPEPAPAKRAEVEAEVKEPEPAPAKRAKRKRGEVEAEVKKPEAAPAKRAKRKRGEVEAEVKIPEPAPAKKAARKRDEVEAQTEAEESEKPSTSTSAAAAQAFKSKSKATAEDEKPPEKRARRGAAVAPAPTVSEGKPKTSNKTKTTKKSARTPSGPSAVQEEEDVRKSTRATRARSKK